MKQTQQRLLRDLKMLKKVKREEAQFDAAPNRENLFFWNATIFGPPDTIWADAVFKLTIEYPQNYPMKPPNVHFVNKIPFHPNIASNGKICLDMLKDNWTPAYDTYAILAAIQTLLDHPNTESPINNEAAQLYETDRRAYDLEVRRVVASTWN